VWWSYSYSSTIAGGGAGLLALVLVPDLGAWKAWKRGYIPSFLACMGRFEKKYPKTLGGNDNIY